MAPDQWSNQKANHTYQLVTSIIRLAHLSPAGHTSYHLVTSGNIWYDLISSCQVSPAGHTSYNMVTPGHIWSPNISSGYT